MSRYVNVDIHVIFGVAVGVNSHPIGESWPISRSRSRSRSDIRHQHTSMRKLASSEYCTTPRLRCHTSSTCVKLPNRIEGESVAVSTHTLRRCGPSCSLDESHESHGSRSRLRNYTVRCTYCLLSTICHLVKCQVLGAISVPNVSISACPAAESSCRPASPSRISHTREIERPQWHG